MKEKAWKTAILMKIIQVLRDIKAREGLYSIGDKFVVFGNIEAKFNITEDMVNELSKLFGHYLYIDDKMPTGGKASGLRIPKEEWDFANLMLEGIDNINRMF